MTKNGFYLIVARNDKEAQLFQRVQAALDSGMSPDAVKAQLVLEGKHEAYKKACQHQEIEV